MCLCVCVCVCACAWREGGALLHALVEVCFYYALVLCFEIGYVLQFGEIAQRKDTLMVYCLWLKIAHSTRGDKINKF